MHFWKQRLFSVAAMRLVRREIEGANREPSGPLNQPGSFIGPVAVVHWPTGGKDRQFEVSDRFLTFLCWRSLFGNLIDP
jgi:hypothetical protein